MLLHGLTDPDALSNRAILIAENLCRPFEVLDVAGAVSVNIGGALSPRDGENEAELLLLADRNMYRAKQSRKSYCGA